MCWPVTKQNNVKNHLVCAAKVTLVHNIIIAETAEGAPKNLNIGISILNSSYKDTLILQFSFTSSTPCPNAKHGEEWGDPSGCDNGDMCQYCHTRTEQQFHPEIYKSTKCHDMQTNSYCPRGSFCAFAHGDFEVARDNGQYQV